MKPIQLLVPVHHALVPQVVRIEVSSYFQIPGLHIVGLASKEIIESKERVRAALEKSKLGFPKRKVVINLAPASLPKRGTLFDLPIALAVVSSGVKCEETGSLNVMAWGELSLDGSIRSAGYIVRNLLAAVSTDVDAVLLPFEEKEKIIELIRRLQGQFSSRPQFIFCKTLEEAATQFRFIQEAKMTRELTNFKSTVEKKTVLTGSFEATPFVVKMLQLILIGRHHAIIVGPRGTGKSSLGDLLQKLRGEASIANQINHHSVIELQKKHEGTDQPWQTRVPFVRCSPNVRPQTLVGGLSSQSCVHPGLMSQASGGFLFADEFLEWHSDSRECLREALERQKVTLNQSKAQLELEADIQFIATANECPCGEKKSKCRCEDATRSRYLNRFSGPILDRVDLAFVYEMATVRKKYSIAHLSEDIHRLQQTWLTHWPRWSGQLRAVELDAYLERNTEVQKCLDSIAHPSLRSRHKALRLALTLAALEGKQHPLKYHFNEASMMRPSQVIEGLQDRFERLV